MIQTSTIHILFVFGRIVASIIRIRPNTTHPLFGTALFSTYVVMINQRYRRTDGQTDRRQAIARPRFAL